MFPYGVAVIVFLIGLALVWEAVTWANLDPRGLARPSQRPVLWWGGLGIIFAGAVIGGTRWLNFLALGCLALAVGVAATATSAFAADSAAVSIPYGQWLADGLGYALEIAGLWLVYLVRNWIPDSLRQYVVNEVLKNATHFAVAVTPGAVHGQSVDLPQTSPLIANFERYVLQNAPMIAKWLGDTLRAKAIARLSAAGMLPADFDASKV